MKRFDWFCNRTIIPAENSFFSGLLKRSEDARIIYLSSGLANAHEISVKSLYPVTPPNINSRYYSYCNSKACNVLLAQELSKKLANFNIKVNAADPGVVKTHIFDSLEGPEGVKRIPRMLCRFFQSSFATVS